MLSQHRTIPLVVAAAFFMEMLDSTVLATALPSMARDLGVPPVNLSLAITAYVLSLAVFIPASGWMADRFGARRIFMAAILVFLAGSIACGLSGSMAELVAARVLQGLGGAMMTPVGRLIVLRSLPKSGLVNAMAWVTMPALIGPVAGPPLGGFIVTHFDWRWIFWINVPVGLLGLLAVYLVVPRLPPQPRVWPFDLWGYLLAAGGLVVLMTGLELTGKQVVGSAVLGLILAAGLALLALYVRHARRTAHPVLDLRLLGKVTFRTSVLGGFLFRVAIGSLPLLLPLTLQLGFGYDALESGLTTFVSAMGAFFAKPLIARLLRRLGFRSLLVGNALINGAFIAVLALLDPRTGLWLFLLLLFVGGFSRSFQFAAVNALAYADVSGKRMSQATSFTSTAQQVSLACGIAFAALLLHLLAGPGGTPSQADFAVAFYVIGGVGALAALVFLTLPADSGAEISGRPAARLPATSISAASQG